MFVTLDLTVRDAEVYSASAGRGLRRRRQVHPGAASPAPFDRRCRPGTPPRRPSRRPAACTTTLPRLRIAAVAPRPSVCSSSGCAATRTSAGQSSTFNTGKSRRHCVHTSTGSRRRRSAAPPTARCSSSARSPRLNSRWRAFLLSAGVTGLRLCRCVRCYLIYSGTLFRLEEDDSWFEGMTVDEQEVNGHAQVSADSPPRPGVRSR